ncbi:MAG: manganese efflux pump [Clostridia bacterium]|nr:manganese efflux pump [Clostridia bacterium]
MLNLIITALGLGVSLAMDAFSVSLSNGLAEPCGTKRRAATIAGIFSLFQMAMPLIGWVLVLTVAQQFHAIQKFIPYIAFGILLFIGGKMLFEGIGELLEKRRELAEGKTPAVSCAMARTSFVGLLIQGVATSIDALSAGLAFDTTIWWEALLSAGIIAVVTFILCFAGVFIGRKFGTKLAEKATILGGVILIAIGIKILIQGILA